MRLDLSRTLTAEHADYIFEGKQIRYFRVLCGN